MLYDFLGSKPTDPSSPVVLTPKTAVSEASPSASASVGASSGGGGGGGGGGRGPISSTSDLASERQGGNHLEGVPFYGTRSDISGPEISTRLGGSKRSNPESAFMAHDYPESLHLMKILRNGAGGERPRRSNDDEVFYGMQSTRPTSASLILQPPTGSRIDANISRWDRSIPMNAGPALQYPTRGGQLVPFMHQVPPNRFKDANAGPPIISQSAADEGSRTGIKGPESLRSSNASAAVAEKNSSAVQPSGSKLKPGTLISEPESSTPPNRQGLTSAGRQMTIFYGGQAHVFDDVHPNKADVIMALAGSNGGSWSTTYSPKSNVRPLTENFLPSGDLEARVASTMALPQEIRGRLLATGNISQGTGSNDRIVTPTGYQVSSVGGKDTRNPSQAREPRNEEKREIAHRLDKAETVIADSIRLGILPDAVTYNNLIDAYCQLVGVDAAYRVLDRMREAGISPDVVSYNSLMAGAAMEGLLPRLQGLFEEMCQKDIHPDVWSFNTLMHCFFKSGKPDEANKIFWYIMNNDLTPCPATFNIMINGLCKNDYSDYALTLFWYLRSCGFVPKIITYNILIDGLCKAGRVKAAKRILRELGQSGNAPNAITYTTVMKCCFKNGQFRQGFEILSEMERKGYTFDGYAYCTVIAALVKVGRTKEASHYMEQMTRNGIQLDIVSYNTLINLYCKEGNLEVVSKLLCEMEERGLECDKYTHTILIQGLCRSGDIKRARQHLHSMNMSFDSKLVAYNCVVDGLGKDGQIDNAMDMFKSMERKDTFTYSSVVHNLCKARSYRHLHKTRLRRLASAKEKEFSNCRNIR
ncbi:hypothetical protein LWI29_026674 [Acer saccharum]|uniref:Tify domain-containing protein n=1 Tax=Acer saccharum TaxID=4024 RepID=A0AA39RF19_ACESA|nr:hypothetical protein LWI29_026674 [Acer saccharum]